MFCVLTVDWLHVSLFGNIECALAHFINQLVNRNTLDFLFGLFYLLLSLSPEASYVILGRSLEIMFRH